MNALRFSLGLFASTQRLLAGVCLFCASIMLHGQELPVYRPVTEEDLIGFWKQVTVQAKEERDVETLWYSGLQFWEFFPDGYLRVILFERGNPTEESLRIIRENGPRQSLWRLVDPMGIIAITYPNGNRYRVFATFYEQDVPLVGIPGSEAHSDVTKWPSKGDITLTYMNLKTGEPEFFRLLRKIGPVVEPLPEVDQAPLPQDALQTEAPVPIERDEAFRELIWKLDQADPRKK